MAVADRPSRSTDEVRRDIEEERRRLTAAVSSLRGEIGFGRSLRSQLPFAAAALVAGFVLAGGIGATVRLLFRRGRERKGRLAL
jgi:hypothetical protein